MVRRLARFWVAAVIAVFVLLTVASIASAQGIAWHPERLTASGSGCKFSNSPNRQQDAWVVTAGEEVSIVYSALGSVFRGRRNGVLASTCNLFLPADISPGYFVSQVEQKFIYGISKQVGVEATINAVSNFARVTPNGMTRASDLNKTLATASIVFPMAQEINIAVGESAMVPIRVRNDGDALGVYARFCARKRPKEMVFHSVMRILLRRQSQDAAVVVAIDGQDLKFTMRNRVVPCPSLVQ